MNPIKGAIDAMKAKLSDLTDNNFAGFKKALPDLFANGDSNVTDARTRLMTLIGNAETAADQKFLGMPIRDLAQLGDTLYDAAHSFSNHTNQISGVASEGVALLLMQLSGNVKLQGTTVSGACTATSLSIAGVTPKINIGDTIIVNTQELTVLGKGYSVVPTGTVTVSPSANLNVSASGVNLASYISTNQYIKIGNEIKRVNVVNTIGDYLTVYTPFRNSYSGSTVNVESTLSVNAGLTSTATGADLYIRTQFCANSLCMDTFITGNGTNFTNYVSVGSKVYYDEKEYFVLSVTDTKIEVDQPLFLRDNQIIQWVVDERIFPQLAEGNNPDDILSYFGTIGQMTNGMDDRFQRDLSNLTTKFRKSDGTYETINVMGPTDVTQSLKNSSLANRVTHAVQGILDDFQRDMLYSLSNADITLLLESKITEIQQIRDDMLDSVKRDIAALNAIKGLLTGLLKLFIISCSKKKKSDGDGTSDEYLNMILMPNPMRQGCLATESDLIGILDDSFAEYCDPGLPTTEFVPYVDTEAIDAAESLYEPDDGYGESEQNQFPVDNYGIGGDTVAGPDGTGQVGVVDSIGDSGFISIDAEPELPAKVVDPCSQPC